MTGWLQIQAVRPIDEGTYRCLARNTLGQIEASASLTVLTPGKRHLKVGMGRWCWTHRYAFPSGGLCQP